MLTVPLEAKGIVGVSPAGSTHCRSSRPPTCGEDGDRTRDLLLAKQALSQLSYFPLSFATPPQCGYLDSNQGPQLYQSCALAN